MFNREWTLINANTDSGFHSRPSAFIRGSLVRLFRIEIHFDDLKWWRSPRSLRTFIKHQTNSQDALRAEGPILCQPNGNALGRVSISVRRAEGPTLTKGNLANSQQGSVVSIHFSLGNRFATVLVVFLKHRDTEVTEPEEIQSEFLCELRVSVFQSRFQYPLGIRLTHSGKLTRQ